MTKKNKCARCGADIPEIFGTRGIALVGGANPFIARVCPDCKGEFDSYLTDTDEYKKAEEIEMRMHRAFGDEEKLVELRAEYQQTLETFRPLADAFVSEKIERQTAPEAPDLKKIFEWRQKYLSDRQESFKRVGIE